MQIGIPNGYGIVVKVKEARIEIIRGNWAKGHPTYMQSFSFAMDPTADFGESKQKVYIILLADGVGFPSD